jgi:hypothetical protein
MRQELTISDITRANSDFARIFPLTFPSTLDFRSYADSDRERPAGRMEGYRRPS